MVRSDGDRDLDQVVASVRAVSAELENLARERSSRMDLEADGDVASDGDGELQRVVGSIRRVSERLQALAANGASLADPENAGLMETEARGAAALHAPPDVIWRSLDPAPPEEAPPPRPHPSQMSDQDPFVSTRRPRSAPFRVAYPSASRSSGVGWRLKFISEEVYDCGALLVALVEENDRAERHSAQILAGLAKLLETVESQVCRISVIGQVKAGKSCLTNALVGQQDLLPTGVNPWTGVVTELYLGDPKGRTAGADFYFFSEDEWKLLVEGGGRLRELTERYVPGFDEERLREQIETIRGRVKERLGPDFDRLLGQRHHFDVCDPQLLETYVCSGAYATTLDLESSLGKFSDLTRLAAVYLPKGDFEFPTIIVDTPGTNDPLLVRDEITRQSLQTNDIHIVVLTAHQTLTTADLALLRILNGLHKDRIIIFINRIDQLNDVTSDGETIVASVRAWMKEEFPGVNIPILCGSAWWAERGARVNASNAAPMISAPLASLARSIGAASPKELALWETKPGEAHKSIARALGVCSGLPALKAGISEMMMQGAQAAYLRQAIGVLLTLASFVETAIGETRAQVVRDAGLPRAPNGARAANGANMRDRVGALGDLSAAIRRHIKKVGGEFEALGSEATSQLGDSLRSALAAFSKREGLRLREAWGKQGLMSWQCDTPTLRRDLENVVKAAYGTTRMRVLVAQKAAISELRRLLVNGGLGTDISVGDGPLADLYPPPPVSALSKTVSLDLSINWWRQWWSRGRTLDENCANLDRLIREEFYPVIDEIARSSKGDFTHHITVVITHFMTLCADLVQVLHDDLAGFATMIEHKPAAPEPSAETLLDIGAALARADERLTACHEISARLRDLLRHFPVAAAESAP